MLPSFIRGKKIIPQTDDVSFQGGLLQTTNCYGKRHIFLITHETRPSQLWGDRDALFTGLSSLDGCSRTPGMASRRTGKRVSLSQAEFDPLFAAQAD